MVEPSTTPSLLAPGVGAGEGVWGGAEVGAPGSFVMSVHTVSVVVVQAVLTPDVHVELAAQTVHGV